MSKGKPKRKKSTQRAAYVDEPMAAPCLPGAQWRVRLLRHDLTGTDELDFRGFRTDGERLPSVRIAAEKRSDIRAIIKELDARSARIPHDARQRLDFVTKLVRSAPTEAVIATSKPGFRDKATGFVMPTKMYGTAKGQYMWAGDKEVALGQQRGTLNEYRSKVLKPIVLSPLLCLSVMCALAALLPSYFLQRTGSKILSETMGSAGRRRENRPARALLPRYMACRARESIGRLPIGPLQRLRIPATT
jgi:hypothetical protein